MARPKPNLPDREALTALIDGGGRLGLRATPNAGQNAMSIEDGQLRVRVTAAPEEGKANAAIVKLAATALGIAPGRISVIRGETGRDKVLKIES